MNLLTKQAKTKHERNPNECKSNNKLNVSVTKIVESYE